MPDEVDAQFLQTFRTLIESHLSTHQFIIVCGGGKTARRYQTGLSSVFGNNATPEQLDWIGIDASVLNARLMREVLAPHAAGEVITDPRTTVADETSVAIAAGWKPGHSTDYDAVQLAISNGCTTVINLSNIAHVYDSDPHTHPNAKPYEHMTWTQYRALVGSTWTPGMSAPFDPIAAQLAEEHDIRVIIGNGSDSVNVAAMIADDSFIGTVIHNNEK